MTSDRQPEIVYSLANSPRVVNLGAESHGQSVWWAAIVE